MIELRQPRKRSPLRLGVIPWGKPDRATAFAVCDSLVNATPPTVIPANPITEYRMRRVLRQLHVVTL